MFSLRRNIMKNVKDMTDSEIQELMTKHYAQQNRQKFQTFKDRELIRFAKRMKLDEKAEYISACEKFKKSLSMS